MISLGGIGLAVVSVLMGWEFWVPPLLVIAVVFLWFMHITEQPSPGIRKVCYFLYAVLAVFYHGVHDTSMFDISVVILLAMAGFSFRKSNSQKELFRACEQDETASECSSVIYILHEWSDAARLFSERMSSCSVSQSLYLVTDRKDTLRENTDGHMGCKVIGYEDRISEVLG